MKKKRGVKQVWDFIWKGDSVWSWLAELLIAFILIKFLVYPLLGLMLGTSFPIVAVMSNSMNHNGENFDLWWNNHKEFYEMRNITYEEFERYPLRNGFNKGDIIFLSGVKKNKLKQGMIVVYWSQKQYPIIHRVIGLYNESNMTYIKTKGDNNPGMIINPPVIDESRIPQDNLVGKALFKIPYVGYVKIIMSWVVGLI